MNPLYIKRREKHSSKSPGQHHQPELMQHQPGTNEYDLVVFCHLRWEFVFQRPQHIISRLAKNRKILIVEEPIAYDPSEENSAKITKVSQNISILQPRVKTIADISHLLPRYLSSQTIPIAWFYSAAFSDVLQTLNVDRVIYDCMDELTLFRGADPLLIEREKHLMSKADIVFTGGKSLYDAKSTAHKNVWCFPSSVEQVHFSKALNGIAIPEDIKDIQGPVIGYYGVIDERIDLELLAGIADMNQDATFVMIGPLAKISNEDLPQRKNIKYLGMRSYDVLPNYLKRFDIAMMPFALNDATKFISPTKTLEYMAAGKPIISTAIYDVVRDYSNQVAIISDAEGFSRAKQAILEQLDTNTYDTTIYDDILDSTSWDHTVNRMEKLISNFPARL